MRYELIIATIIPALWLVWLLYWWYSARDVKRTVQPEPFHSQLKHLAALIYGILCFRARQWMPRPLAARFVPAGLFFPALGTVMLALGLGFTVWARRDLGRNWSAHVVVKENHALIQSGPYHYVRHPIYTGCLFAMLGMAIASGERRSRVG